MSENNPTEHDQTTKPKILELAGKVPDPKSEKFKKHPLSSMIFIALVSTVCGADDWVTVSDIGEHLEGWIITADALNTQKTTAAAAIKANADYVLPVKGNQKDLFEDIELLFEDAESKDYRGIDADQFETKEEGHGRVEHRIYKVLDAEDLPVAKEWMNMKSTGKVIRRRTSGDRSTFEVCYFIMSIEIDAELFAHAVRGHWGVENKLHWTLDVIFREDHSKYRDRIGAQNLSAVRKMALGLLKKDASTKKSLKRKRFQALTSPEFRFFRERIFQQLLFCFA